MNIRVLLFITVALRAAYALWGFHLAENSGPFLTPDSATYIGVAESIFSGRGFQMSGEPDLNRTPGYPVVLIPGFLLGNVIVWALFVQIVASCLCVLLIIKAVELLGGDGRARLIAGYLYAFEPLSISYASLVLTETTFTTVLLLSLVLMLKLLRSELSSGAIAVGITLAVAAYIRPLASLFIPVVVCFLLVLALIKKRAVFVRFAMIVGIAAATLLAPWLIRNRSLGYTGMSINSVYNLYFQTAASVVAHKEHRPLPEVQQEWGMNNRGAYLKRFPDQANWSTVARYNFMQAEALRIIRQFPFRLGYLHLRGMTVVLLGPGAGEFDNFLRIRVPDVRRVSTQGALYSRPVAGNVAYRVLQGALFLGLILTWIFSLVGLRWLSVWDSRSAAFIVLLVGFFVATTGGAVGYSRFRHPCMPLIVICAAFGVSRVTGTLDGKWLKMPRLHGPS